MRKENFMKFKYLITLPLVAVLASCGTSRSAAEKVNQKLPSDVKKVAADDEAYQDYINAAIDSGLGNLLSFDDTLYHLRVDFDGKLNLKSEQVKSNNNASVHGDVYLGWNVLSTEDDDYFFAYVGVKDFTVKAHVEYPVFDEETEALVNTNYDFNYKNLSLQVFYEELPGVGALAFIDLSNHGVQDLLKQALVLAGLPEESTVDPETEEPVIGYKDILDLVLGTAEEGETYRPGYSYINISQILQAVTEPEGDDGEYTDEQLYTFAHPLPLIMMEAFEEAYESIAEVAQIAKFVLPSLEPTVGAKVDAEGNPEKISIVYNSTVKDVVKKFAGEDYDASELPVSGNFGIKYTVGTNNGSEELCLEELVVAFYGNVTTEDEDVVANGSIDAKLALDVHYGDQAQIEFPLTQQALEPYTKNNLTSLIYIILMVANQPK